jgi:hypothetical protein
MFVLIVTVDRRRTFELLAGLVICTLGGVMSRTGGT